MQDNQQKQLFTELTPEEGAVIVGGAQLELLRATAVHTNGDYGLHNGDDVYIQVNGAKIQSTVNDVDTGETFLINKSTKFSGTASMNFFDDDSPYSSDDFLGGYTFGRTPTNGEQTVRITGGYSTYDVTYRIHA